MRHWGTTGDWYIRSASTSGKVVLQDGGGTVVIGTLGSAGATQLCRNGSNEIATCSSSLRYKDNIVALDLGLATVALLRPVMFDWKGTGEHDLGFVAEEVNAVAPILTTRNAEGQIEGVKYDRLTAVLAQAMQEQQQQIVKLQARIAELERGAPTREANVSDMIAFGALLVSAFALYRARKGGDTLKR